MFHLQSTLAEVAIFFVAVIAIGSLASRGERKSVLGFLLSLSVVLVLPVLAFYFLFAVSNDDFTRVSILEPSQQSVQSSEKFDAPSFEPKPGGMIVRSTGRTIRSSQDSNAPKGRLQLTISDGQVEGTVSVKSDQSDVSTVLVQSSTSAADADTTTVQPHGDGEVLVLPLNEALLKEMLGAEAVAAIEALNESVAPELRQAYAMIPISGPRVTPLQQIITGPTPKGLGVLTEAVSGLIATPLAEAEAEVEAALASTIPEALRAETLPDWVEQPWDGHMTVTSEFTDDLNADPLALIEPKVEDALGQKYYALLSDAVGTHGRWDRLMKVQVSDEVLKSSVSQLSTEVTNVSEAYQKDVIRTHALVKIPTRLSPEMLKTAESAVRINRMLAVCATVVLLWLAALLASLLLRNTSGKSMFRKAVVAPVLGLAMVPCLVFAVFVIKGMAEGENFDEWAEGPVVCVVDELE